MDDTFQNFACLICRQQKLQPASSQLMCEECGAVYPVQSSVPILLPDLSARSVLQTPETQGKTLEDLRAIYDRAYAHDGLMGTDLDGNYDRATKAQLLSFVGPLAGKRVLDVGAGIGKLWDYVTADVDGYAIDLSLMGMTKALQRHPTLTTSVSIAEFLPFADGYFHGVVAADTLEHTFAPRRALAEIHRVLAPGGVLGASFPIPDSLRKWGWNTFVRQRPSPRLLWNLMRVMARRTLLFGRPDFQPIDRDYVSAEWVQLLQETGFIVEQVISWPEAPKVPIVTLVRALRS